MVLRVLVADDMVLFRKVVTEALASLPGVEVLGTASHGRMALSRIETMQPDLITLDLEMPEMDGLQVMQAIKEKGLEVGVIVLSSLSVKGGELTIKALELGAFDFLAKPAVGSIEQNREAIRAGLAPMLKAFANRLELRQILKSGRPPESANASAAATLAPVNGKAATAVAPAPAAARPRPVPVYGKNRPEMIVLGISTGGPNALTRMLPELPANLSVPVLIVQHMPPTFTRSLADNLDTKCAIRVKEAENGERILPGVAYIAPGGRQMKLVAENGQKIIRITDDPPENNCRPSVDTLFRSVALNFPGSATGVIMTGMGSDGTLGLKLMKRGGCHVIAQDEGSCVVFGMPREAIAAGVVDVVVPLDEIAAEILKTVR